MPDAGTGLQLGSLSWSVIPPGRRCTYTQELNGLDRVDGPGPVLSLWLLALVGLVVGLTRGYARTFPRKDPA